MTIGVDLSPIQGPHRMRGIGYTLISLINNMPSNVKEQHTFVFYMLPVEQSSFDPLTILELSNLKYETRSISETPKITRRLPGRLNFFVSIANSIISIHRLWMGARNYNLQGVDAFLQTDQNKEYPHTSRLKKMLVIYDLIPYTLEWDYMWSYKTARQIKGFSRRAALRVAARRELYKIKVGLNIRKADILIAISQTTKRDFIEVFGVNENKVKVIPLGVPEAKSTGFADVRLKEYVKTSWGYLPQDVQLDPEVPFLLFVGGADRRRKLQDLVQAFNNLRAKGVDIKLVLAGDSMKSPDTIATEEIQYALRTSSYLEDIIFLGFIDDVARDWLYKNALAYVFPSRYEGFGLPVLEAMSYGCPVISYPNEATIEVAGKAPLYANNAGEIENAINKLLTSPELVQNMKNKGSAVVATYSWNKTSQEVFGLLR